MAIFPGQIAAAPTPARQPKPRRSRKADLKREAIEIARSFGWRGRTYEKAVRFLRRLERRLKAEAAS